eukprot:scaffold12676_cov151-Skeletonema_marinoi.AAC.1
MVRRNIDWDAIQWTNVQTFLPEWTTLKKLAEEDRGDVPKFKQPHTRLVDEIGARVSRTTASAQADNELFSRFSWKALWVQVLRPKLRTSSTREMALDYTDHTRVGWLLASITSKDTQKCIRKNHIKDDEAGIYKDDWEKAATYLSKTNYEGKDKKGKRKT